MDQKLAAKDQDLINLAKQIRPLLLSVCSDGNSDSAILADEIAERVLEFIYSPPPLTAFRSGISYTFAPNPAVLAREE